MGSSSRGIDRIAVTFDEPTLVADAGLVVPATLMVRQSLSREFASMSQPWATPLSTSDKGATP